MMKHNISVALKYSTSVKLNLWCETSVRKHVQKSIEQVWIPKRWITDKTCYQTDHCATWTYTYLQTCSQLCSCLRQCGLLVTSLVIDHVVVGMTPCNDPGQAFAQTSLCPQAVEFDIGSCRKVNSKFCNVFAPWNSSPGLIECLTHVSRETRELLVHLI